MHATAQRVQEAAQECGLQIEIVEFDQTTRTAPDAAAAIGCKLAQIVKSLLFVADGQPVMALVSGANRLHEGKLARLCGVGRKKVKRADADQTRQATGFVIGGVPPFGHATTFPVYVDEDLMRLDIVWAAAGTPHTVFAIRPDELLRASRGSVADLKAD
jgi:Cys-tRNA(Pro) deacylase